MQEFDVLTSAVAAFGSIWTTLAATAIFAIVAFALFMLTLAIPAFRGRAIKRKCACAASRDALRILEERERAKRDAMLYSAETVDVERLPMASSELADYARRERR